MKHARILLMVIVLVLVGLLAGCQQQAPAAGGEMPTDAALKVTGKVDNEVGWTADELRGLDTTEAQFTNKAGETSTYTGVSLNALLDKAGVADDATAIIFVGDDGYRSPEVALEELRACTDCIVSFREQDSFSTVLPGFPGNVQVRGVVEIQVQ